MLKSPTLSSLIPSLDLARDDEVPHLPWLEESYRDPSAFWTLLLEHARLAYPPATRSSPGVAIDLYTDAVSRHAHTSRVALRWYDRRIGWQQLSFADLDAKAGSLASAWIAEGVQPGAVIAVLLPLGPDVLIALAAALRLGACVSFLPPEHDRYLAPRLAKLAPSHLVFDPRRRPPVGDELEKLLLSLVGSGPAPSSPPYAFKPEDSCARVFSPLRAPLDTPLDVSAEAAFLHALRDATLGYRLSAGDGLAAPGFHARQHFPALLLCTLLAGATFVHIPFEDIEDKPELLEAQPIHVLGVTPALCALLRQKPTGTLPALRHVFRPVDEPLDWLAYRDFIVKNDLGKMPVSNLLIDAAEGGCLLFSTRRPGSVHARVLPSAGRPFMLFDPGTGKEAVGDQGIYVPLPSKKPEEDGWIVLARVGEEYLFGGSYLPRRGGKIFPATELTDLLAEMPFIQGAAVAPVPTGEPGGRFAFVLVVFTGAAPEGASQAEQDKTRALLEETIHARLGPDFVPDRVELAPLFPRWQGTKVDADWCRAQYLSGRLGQKADEPIVQTLTALRAEMLGR